MRGPDMHGRDSPGDSGRPPPHIGGGRNCAWLLRLSPTSKKCRSWEKDRQSCEMLRALSTANRADAQDELNLLDLLYSPTSFDVFLSCFIHCTPFKASTMTGNLSW